MRLAILSDIHGNRWALEAVLDDVARRGVRRLVNLGDSLYGPLDPAGTAQVLIPMALPSVCGNEDRAITDPSGVHSDSPPVRFARDNLEPGHLQWLEHLPLTFVAFDRFRLFHGTPQRDDEYLLREVREDGVFLRGADQLAEGLRDLSEPVLLCGHDHTPAVVNLPDGRIIVNPGSVGCPAYTDDAPFVHVIEGGSPHARYSLLSETESGWLVENVAVPYDWHAAAAAAERHGRPDWAAWLGTGRAS